jgi:curved DNA-binding protein
MRPALPDHYEILQLSPSADRDTIDRVFRHLAKRFHPDNPETGDAEHYGRIREAFEVLADPERRASYDATYEREREARWRVFDQDSAGDDVTADRQVREAILSLLYTARRNDPDRPGVGIVEMERVLGCPEEHMKFHIWYLRENGWLTRLETGAFAITASGVDRVMEMGGPKDRRARLMPGIGGLEASGGRAAAG